MADAPCSACHATNFLVPAQAPHDARCCAVRACNCCLACIESWTPRAEHSVEQVVIHLLQYCLSNAWLLVPAAQLVLHPFLSLPCSSAAEVSAATLQEMNPLVRVHSLPGSWQLPNDASTLQQYDVSCKAIPGLRAALTQSWVVAGSDSQTFGNDYVCQDLPCVDLVPSGWQCRLHDQAAATAWATACHSAPASWHLLTPCIAMEVKMLTTLASSNKSLMSPMHNTPLHSPSRA